MFSQKKADEYKEIKDMLIRHEGLVPFPYKDSSNPPKITIGVGRLLHNDIERVLDELDQSWNIWRTFRPEVQMVCIDLVFNMGIVGWMRFVQTRFHMENGDFLAASEELLRSKYHIQLPSRSEYNSRQLALCQQKATTNKTKPNA
jgi:hypothetical protein